MSPKEGNFNTTHHKPKDCEWECWIIERYWGWAIVVKHPGIPTEMPALLLSLMNIDVTQSPSFLSDGELDDEVDVMWENQTLGREKRANM